jgi:Arc/MetJ family transcription regulator
MCYYKSMKKPRMITTIRIDEQDREAIEAIKAYYGITSDNDAVRFALRTVWRGIPSAHPLPQQGEADQPPRE